MKIQVRLGPKPTMTHVHPEVPGEEAMAEGVRRRELWEKYERGDIQARFNCPISIEVFAQMIEKPRS